MYDTKIMLVVMLRQQDVSGKTFNILGTYLPV